MVYTSCFRSCSTTSLLGALCPNKKKKTYDLRKLGKIRKISKLQRIIIQCPVHPLNLQKTAEKKKLKFSCIGLFHLKTKICLIYFAHDCFWKQFFPSNLPHSPSNLFFLTVFLTIRFCAQFVPNIGATKLRKSPKFCLTWQLLYQSFTDVQIRYWKTFKFGPRRFLER